MRSDSANRYYWAVIIPAFMEYTGYEKDEMHEVLKERLLGETNMVTGRTAIKSTTRLTRAQFSQYIEAAKRLAAKEGVRLRG